VKLNQELAVITGGDISWLSDRVKSHSTESRTSISTFPGTCSKRISCVWLLHVTLGKTTQRRSLTNQKYMQSRMNLFCFYGDVSEWSVGQCPQHRPLPLHRHPCLRSFAILDTKFHSIAVLVIFCRAEVAVFNTVSRHLSCREHSKFLAPDRQLFNSPVRRVPVCE